MVKGQVVARYSRMRPINRIKHVVDIQTAVPVNTQVVNPVAVSVNTSTLASAHEVEIGSTVSSIFLTIEAVASETSTTATPNFYFYIAKNPGNNLTLPNPNNVGVDDNKRFIFHQEMVMINALDGGSPRNVFKGVISVPKGYRRMGPNDRITVTLFSPSTAVAVNACWQAHYKEFR